MGNVSPPDATSQGNRFYGCSHGKFSRPCFDRLHFASWNVEGLTDIKLHQLCSVMHSRAISLMCLQETWDSCSGSRTVCNGYLLVNSGSDVGGRTYAGVAFLVAPWFRHCIYSFKHISERVNILKLRFPGGKFQIINTYAPHNGYAYDIRQSYFSQLGQVVADTSNFGMKIIVGDFNSRIHRRSPGEEAIFGEYCYGKPLHDPRASPESNRELLVVADVCGQYFLQYCIGESCYFS